MYDEEVVNLRQERDLEEEKETLRDMGFQSKLNMAIELDDFEEWLDDYLDEHIFELDFGD